MSVSLRKITLLIFFVLVVIGCSYFIGFNPIPPVDRIRNADIRDQTIGQSGSVPNDRLIQMYELFNGSTKTLFPSKWQVFGFIRLTYQNGNIGTIYIYSTSDSIGAFKFNGQYFRGGSDNSFKSFFNEITGG